jgi:hypothetical protein
MHYFTSAEPVEVDVDKSKASKKGSTFEEILKKYRKEANPVTKASYRDIMIDRLKRHQIEGGKLE